MKKFILILLTCAMLIGCLASCNILDPQSNAQPEPEPNNNGLDKHPPIEDNNNDLISILSDYLKRLYISYDMPPTPTLDEEIDDIKNGKQALLVEFIASDYYFICCYYESDHDEHNYCCVDKYTWAGFENAVDILEYYDDKKIIAAFQINKAYSVTDIVNDETKVSSFEHFELFEMEFEGGYNINKAIDFSKTLVYLNENYDTDTIFYSTSVYNNDWFTIPCIKLDGGVYLKIHTHCDYYGDLSYIDLDYEFGKYYDSIIDIMYTDKYSTTASNGEVIYYFGLIEINDFVENIVK